MEFLVPTFWKYYTIFGSKSSTIQLLHFYQYFSPFLNHFEFAYGTHHPSKI